jgi:hypothetical protein
MQLPRRPAAVVYVNPPSRRDRQAIELVSTPHRFSDISRTYWIFKIIGAIYAVATLTR